MSWLLRKRRGLSKSLSLELDVYKRQVLDLDETVLDNSPYQVKNVKDGTAFTPENWDVWVQKAEAKAVPGAKDFSPVSYTHLDVYKRQSVIT